MNEKYIKELQDIVEDMEGSLDPFAVGPYMRDLEKIIEEMKRDDAIQEAVSENRVQRGCFL